MRQDMLTSVAPTALTGSASRRFPGLLTSALTGLSVMFAGHALAQEQERPDSLVSAAGAYATLQEDAARYRHTAFGSIADIDAAMDEVASLDPNAGASAWLAYAALVALDTPEFVASVRQARDYYGLDAMANGLRVNTGYAAQLAGGDAAKTAMFARVTRDSLDGRVAAANIKAQAYDLQSQPWAVNARGDADARLAAVTNARARNSAPQPATLEALLVRSLDATPEAGLTLAAHVETGQVHSGSGRSLFGSALRAMKISRRDRPGGEIVASRSLDRRESIGEKIVREQNEAEPPMGIAPSAQMDAALDHALTLAALTALGVETSEDVSTLTPRAMSRCLQTAKLHLQQCVAVSRFAYEDPFCIAEHGLDDVAMCYTEGRYTR